MQIKTRKSIISPLAWQAYKMIFNSQCWGVVGGEAGEGEKDTRISWCLGPG